VTFGIGAAPRTHRLADTGGVTAIDLNADLAEGDVFGSSDLDLVDIVTSASLACGFHAGSTAVMRAAARACVERGVAIGAHVSYRDRVGFGRRALDVAADRLAADLVEQWDALDAEVRTVGGTVTYVKPHGALYAAMATVPEVADTVVGVLVPRCPVLVGPPAGAHVAVAARAGVRLVPEGFCDRGYEADGRLVARDHPGARVDDAEDAGARARSLAVDGGVGAVDGTWVTLDVATLCLHGDHAGAVARARSVRRALESAGVELAAFAPPPP
jgi:UPF0271 protein